MEGRHNESITKWGKDEPTNSNFETANYAYTNGALHLSNIKDRSKRASPMFEKSMDQIRENAQSTALLGQNDTEINVRATDGFDRRKTQSNSVLDGVFYNGERPHNASFHMSSDRSDREMIAYLMKKHLGVEPANLAKSVVPQHNMSMTNQMRWPTPNPQNWISWGDPKEPVSEYQMIYDQGAKQFNPKEIEKIKKSALWRNMSII